MSQKTNTLPDFGMYEIGYFARVLINTYSKYNPEFQEELEAKLLPETFLSQITVDMNTAYQRATEILALETTEAPNIIHRMERFGSAMQQAMEEQFEAQLLQLCSIIADIANEIPDIKCSGITFRAEKGDKTPILIANDGIRDETVMCGGKSYNEFTHSYEQSCECKSMSYSSLLQKMTEDSMIRQIAEMLGQHPDTDKHICWCIKHDYIKPEACMLAVKNAQNEQNSSLDSIKEALTASRLDYQKQNSAVDAICRFVEKAYENEPEVSEALKAVVPAALISQVASDGFVKHCFHANKYLRSTTHLKNWKENATALAHDMHSVIQETAKALSQSDFVDAFQIRFALQKQLEERLPELRPVYAEDFSTIEPTKAIDAFCNEMELRMCAAALNIINELPAVKNSGISFYPSDEWTKDSCTDIHWYDGWTDPKKCVIADNGKKEISIDLQEVSDAIFSGTFEIDKEFEKMKNSDKLKGRELE